jgi:hypothetical protein
MSFLFLGSHLKKIPFSIHEEPVPPISASTTQNLKAPPGLPLKPVSQLEESRKRNYFPVSWRVIGGGVLIGDPSRKGDVFAISCYSYLYRGLHVKRWQFSC